jgi:SAM-dependent methyltransferase
MDVGCGTGRVLAELLRTGYEAAGLDTSAEMLAHARARVGGDVALHHAALPEIPVPDNAVDAVCSTGGVLNYLPGGDPLTEVLRSVLRALRPGGTFIFDILSRQMLTEHLGRTVWAADLDDFAFIWTFAHPSPLYSDAYYIQFVRGQGDSPGTYTCSREEHRLYVLDPGTVRRSAEQAGFASAEARDNYTDALPGEDTAYETWVLTAPGTTTR